MRERIATLLAGGALAVGSLLLLITLAQPRVVVKESIRPAIIKHTVERKNVCAPRAPDGRIKPPFEKNL